MKRIICLLGLVMLVGFGCRTKPLDHDIFPIGYESQCNNARTDAVKWYQNVRYHTVPIVPCVEVVIKDKPLNGMGAWTPNSHLINIWKDQYPFYGSLTHEFRHTLALENGKGGSEEAVQ